jgi:hypothetical protein
MMRKDDEEVISVADALADPLAEVVARPHLPHVPPRTKAGIFEVMRDAFHERTVLL